MILTLLLSLTTAQAVDCEQPTTNSDLAVVITAAEVAWIRMDLDSFEVSRENALTVLLCLEEPVRPGIAAEFHRMEALGAFVEDDFSGVISSYRSSLALEPEHVLSVEVAPLGHPLREQYELAAMSATSPLEAVTPHKGMRVWIDGLESSSRPTERPVILQTTGPKGTVENTAWLPSRATLPLWASAAPETAERRHRERKAREEGEGMPPAKVALLATTVGAGVGAVGTYALGWSSRARYLDDGTPYDDLERIRSQNHAALVSSGVLLGVAVGTSTGFVLVSTW